MSAKLHLELTLQGFGDLPVNNNIDGEPKKFRKARDYFGKRKHTAISSGGGGGGDKLGFDDDSNDSGVSTRDLMINGGICGISGGGSGGSGFAVKCEPDSPSTASVTSGVSSAASPSTSQSDLPQKQRVKVIRLSNSSLKSILQKGPAASSTPRLPLDEEMSRERQWAVDNIKRNRWEKDLAKVMRLFRGAQIRPMEVKKIIPAVETKTYVRDSSKRRIIPKQRISV